MYFENFSSKLINGGSLQDLAESFKSGFYDFLLISKLE